MNIKNLHSKHMGFTLVELAVVLIIVGLLISGLILPLTAQQDIRDYSDTRKELAEIREAVIGYTLSQNPPYLPCPDIAGNGVEAARDGDGDCVDGSGTKVSAGGLPWVTLGLGQTDSWNNAYLYRVTAGFSNSNGFVLGSVTQAATAGDNVIVDTVATGGIQIADNIPVVIVSKGKNGALTVADTGDDEDENADGDATFVSHEQIDIAASAFDDIVVWVPSTILFNRMVTAGKLP